MKRSDDQSVATLTFENPPVNALGYEARKALNAAVLEVGIDPQVKAVVLVCGGGTFFAGADIKEFGTENATRSPNLKEFCASLDGLSKPVVAAIHGVALGGGLEVALACHYRIAVPDALLGLPEVKLGLIPGAGGTVRLPRLIEATKALRMITTGEPVLAQQAFNEGLVDALASGDLIEAARKFALDKAFFPLMATSRRPVRQSDIAEFAAIADQAISRSRGLRAPVAAARSVRNAVTMSFDEAIAAERRIFLELLAGDESAALRHLFLAERSAQKLKTASAGVVARPLRIVGIVGGGTMGSGIAMSFADNGIRATILELSHDALQASRERIERAYSISVTRGSISEEEKAVRVALIGGATDYDAFRNCDLIIEAVVEDMEVKREVFRQLDLIARPGAILATNTSYLDVDLIAAVTERPGDVVGMHYFSPANVMKLIEIVRGRETRDDVLATALAAARITGKVGVVVGVCDGFVGNRMLLARNAQNEQLLVEGATPEQIDKAFVDFGWPMGPFQMSDMAGLDIGWRTRKRMGRVAPIADALCERGWFGQKTGRGFYLYEAGARQPKPNPDLPAIIAAAARQASQQSRAISDTEIIQRTHFPLVNEGARLLSEGIVARSSDIDLIWTRGYGFPVAKGGPMYWASRQGLSTITASMDRWALKTGASCFSTADVLRRLAGAGASFERFGLALNQGDAA
ncbi:MAG: enoyl-CoA hydratase/isomerase family protein [Mesorhizobium sp.]|nr:enoyl-CoA hydratase/isomerase family protein [Mesorhizobium sp.]